MQNFNQSRQTVDEMPGLGPHETLLSQYKKCSEFNNKQLRDARNLGELVNIKVAAIDQRLTAGGHPGVYPGSHMEQQRQNGYDLQFDPLYARQKVPQMAPKSFLVNQAMLAGSAHNKRNFDSDFGRTGTASTKGTYKTHAGLGLPVNSGAQTQKDKRGNYMPEIEVKDFDALYQQKKGLRNSGADHFNQQQFPHLNASHFSGQFGPRADERLFSGDAASLVDQFSMAPSIPGTRALVTRESNAQRGRNTAFEGQESYDGENKSQVTGHNDGPQEEEDPIKTLKSIFKPKKKGQKAPLELNPVMNKYRARNHTQSQRIRGIRTGATEQPRTNPWRYGPLAGSGKVYTEDMMTNPPATADTMIAYQKRQNQEDMDTMMQDQATEAASRQMASGPHGTEARTDPGAMSSQQQAYQTHNGGMPGSVRSSYGMDATNSQPAPMAQADQRHMGVRERLESLRKLFAEEDVNDTVKNIQQDWELEDQRMGALASRNARGGFHSTQPVKPVGIDNVEDVAAPGDLRGYLANKIQNVQDRSNPNKLQDEQILDQRKSQDDAGPKFKFKASTLTHIAELRGQGQQQIENQFIERLYKQSTDYHFERYTYQQQIKFAKQATDIKQYYAGTAQLNTTLVQDNAPAAQMSGMSATGPKQSGRFRSKKPQNIVQEQLQKMNKINREKEAYHRMLRQEMQAQDIEIAQMHSEQVQEYEMVPPGYDGGTHQEASMNQGTASTIGDVAGMPQEGVWPADVPKDLNVQHITGGGEPMREENVQSAATGQVTRQATGPETPVVASAARKSRAKVNSGPGSPESRKSGTKTVTSKVNLNGLSNQDMQDFPLNQFRVSQLVQEYNRKAAEGTGSPNADHAYASDTELFLSQNRHMRGGLSPGSRGGGFRNRKRGDKNGDDMGDQFLSYEQSLRMRRMQGDDPKNLQAIEEEPFDVTHGHSFSYFCPKRFNRYPRFTIFFKRDQAASNNQYVQENTVSLSPQFLSYLMDKNSVLRNPGEPQRQQAVMEHVRDSFLEGAGPNSAEGAPMQGGANPTPNIPTGEEAVTGWTQKNEAVQNYDPFEKVVLVKGIDNSILTSFRTLKRENNTVSDTFKVVHQKFLPIKHKGLYFKSMVKNHGDKMALYPHSDNEDALEIAQQELMAESLLHQGDETQLLSEEQQRQLQMIQRQVENVSSTTKDATQAAAPFKNRNLGGMPEGQQKPGLALLIDTNAQMPGGKHSPIGGQGTEKQTLRGPRGNRQSVSGEKTNESVKATVPLGHKPVDASGKQTRVAAPKQIVAPMNYMAGDASNVSLIQGQKLQPNLFKNTTDSCNNIESGNQLPRMNPLPSGPGTNKSSVPNGNANKDPTLKASVTDSGRNGQNGNNKNLFKHQIEVMVLSKVDPLDSAFPGGGAPNASDTNLSNSFSQAPVSNILVAGSSKPGAPTLPQGNPVMTGHVPVYHQALIPPLGKRNPFKNVPGQDSSKVSTLAPAAQPSFGTKASLSSPPLRSSTNTLAAQRKAGAPHSRRQNDANDAAMTINENPAKKDRMVSPGGSQAPSTTGKYGKDFKIPELPPLLQAQLFGEESAGIHETPSAQGFGMSAPASQLSPTSYTSAGNTQYKIKKFIDDIYQKEMKYRYHKQYVREDYLLTQSPIFDLQKFHHLRPQGGLLASRTQKARVPQYEDLMRAEQAHGESLTNVLGFQAGGPNVVIPMQPRPSHGQAGAAHQMAQVSQHAGMMGLDPNERSIQQQLPPGGGLYNSNQIIFGAGAGMEGAPLNGSNGSSPDSPARRVPGSHFSNGRVQGFAPDALGDPNTVTNTDHDIQMQGGAGGQQNAFAKQNSTDGKAK